MDAFCCPIRCFIWPVNKVVPFQFIPHIFLITGIYHLSRTWPWTSYQIRKIAGCACTGNSGNVFPATDFKGNRLLAIPACITARASRMSGWLTRGGRENVPGIPGACAPPNFTGKRPMEVSCINKCFLTQSEDVNGDL